MNFRLFDLMSETKTTQLQLSKAVNVSQGNVSDWKNGRSFPKSDVLSRLADYFNVSTDYLLGRTDQKEMPSVGDGPLRSTLLNNFGQLNREGQERLVETSDDMVSSGKYIKSDPNKLGEAKDT